MFKDLVCYFVLIYKYLFVSVFICIYYYVKLCFKFCKFLWRFLLFNEL